MAETLHKTFDSLLLDAFQTLGGETLDAVIAVKALKHILVKDKDPLNLCLIESGLDAVEGVVLEFVLLVVHFGIG